MQWLLDVLAAWADDVKWVHFLTIPVFTGVIGWLINWSGLWMLFSPVRFHGVRVPGMRELVSVLPRKVQEVPGLLQGGLGWQGIIPARAAKMGSIAVDKAIAKLGTPAEFYQQLEPDQIAEHIVTVFRPELPELVDGVMRREHPRLWRDLPGPVRRAVVERVDAQLPTVVGRVTTEIGTHIDQLLDPKIMVIDHFRDNPSLVVRIFRDFGQRELNLMVTFGFVFGFLLGIPVAVVDSIFGLWWLLPVLGVVVGWITNALGMWLIFEPRSRVASWASGSTGSSRAASRRPRRSTPASSPTTSSPSSASATSCSTAPAATVRGRCWPPPCGRPSTSRSGRRAARCGSRWAATASTRSATRWPRTSWAARSRPSVTRTSARARPRRSGCWWRAAPRSCRRATSSR